MSTMTMLRPTAISGYDDNGTRRLMAVSEREELRTETFLRRVLRSDNTMRGRYALITATMRDMSTIGPFERILMSKGIICCNAEANPYDGMRFESIVRRFDIALVAVITPIVLQAIRSAGHDPIKLLQGKIVWAAGKAYEELRVESGFQLRRWAMLGPALALEGPDGGGLHVDGREWKIEPEGEHSFITSRLDRAQAFARLRVDTPIRIVTEPSSTGAYGPRIEL